MSLKPYSAYKDSGVPMLGSIPQHWQVRSLKRWVSINQDTLSEATSPSFEFYYIDIGSVGTGALLEKPRKIRFGDAPSRARRVLSEGDTIVSTVRTYLKAVYSASGEPRPLVASTGFAALTPGPEIVPRFLGYVCQGDPFTNRVSSESVGIAYPAIAETKLASLAVAAGPPEEQAAIARYLDYIDRRIRRYIRAKRRLIALLNEQKQAIIQRAVTRGLDPNVRLKPSGVDWLGDVPEHWEVRRLKTLARMKSGESITSASIDQAGYYPVYGGNGLRGYTSSYTHEGAFVLLGRQGALCGNTHLVQGRFWASEHAIVVTPLPDHSVLWLYYLLQAMNLNQYSIAAAQPGLAVERVLNLSAPVPPRDEQAELAEMIEHEAAHIGTMVRRAGAEIALLREYRTRLIADVVTGKLDVREAAANLPDEADEPEPLDEEEAMGEEIYDEIPADLMEEVS